MSTTTDFRPGSLVTFELCPHNDTDGGVDYTRRTRCVGRIVFFAGSDWVVEVYADGEHTYLPDGEGMGMSPAHRTLDTARICSARVLPAAAWPRCSKCPPDAVSCGNGHDCDRDGVICCDDHDRTTQED